MCESCTVLGHENSRLRLDLDKISDGMLDHDHVTYYKLEMKSVSNEEDDLQDRVLAYTGCGLVCIHGGHPDKRCRTCVQCSSGYTGTHCDVPLSCSCSSRDPTCACSQHGTYDAIQCKCRCALGWNGTLCNNRDTSIDTDVIVRAINEIAEKSRTRNDTVPPDHLGVLPNVGITYDNDITLPIIDLYGYSTSRYVIDGHHARWMVPSKVKFRTVSTSSTMPDPWYKSYRSLQHYIAETYKPHVNNDMNFSQEITRYAMSVANSDGATKFAATYEARQYPSYTMSLILEPFMPVMKQYKLDRYFADAIKMLPLSYDSVSRDVFFALFDKFGTQLASVVTSGKAVHSLTARGGHEDAWPVHSSSCLGGNHSFVCNGDTRDQWIADVQSYAQEYMISYATTSLSDVFYGTELYVPISDALHDYYRHKSIVQWTEISGCENGGWAAAASPVCSCHATMGGLRCQQCRNYRYGNWCGGFSIWTVDNPVMAPLPTHTCGLTTRLGDCHVEPNADGHWHLTGSDCEATCSSFVTPDTGL